MVAGVPVADEVRVAVSNEEVPDMDEALVTGCS